MRLAHLHYYTSIAFGRYKPHSSEAYDRSALLPPQPGEEELMHNYSYITLRETSFFDLRHHNQHSRGQFRRPLSGSWIKEYHILHEFNKFVPTILSDTAADEDPDV